MTATLTSTASSPPPASSRAGRRSTRERLALSGLLVATAALYLVNLSANGWGNDFYAAAVQSMTKNWEAFFFGSFDAGNVVTVDKPPAALWVMALSARVFGLSSWSVLVPQALMAVAAVALLYAAVRRVAGPGAGLLAGAALALTPVAVLMFRFDNPDALLVLLMVASAYAVVRAVEHAGTWWLLLAGALMGLAFLTKTAQAFLVLPALAGAYLWAAPTGLWRRVRQLLATGLAMVVVGGWWFAAVALWPAADRPYIGGSTDNSAVQLALGYNGLGRVFGQGFGGGRGGAGDAMAGGTPGVPGARAAGSGAAADAGNLPGGGFPGGTGGGGPFGGGAGLTRLFANDVGGQIAWLLPAALALLVIGLVLTRRAARTDRLRASLVVWGGWTVVSALVFSLMEGIFHQYYTVALAPGIAALIGIGGALLWQRRSSVAARSALAVLMLGTAVWAWVLLGRVPDFVPWLRWVIVALGVVGAVLILLPGWGRVVATAALVATVGSALLGPAAYAVDTVAAVHHSGIPLAGPATAGGLGPGRFGGDRADRAARDRDNGGAGAATGAGQMQAAGPGQGFGAPGEGQPSDTALVSLLQRAGTKWSAATVGTMQAAPLALDSSTDVMAIGGFSGGDPAPTLARFQSYVAQGQVRYFLAGGGFGGFGGGPAANPRDPADPTGARRGGERGSTIRAWVEQHYTATTIGGRTVYDLTKPKA
jgi:4-amino-4-deoxy-L-arabinose transferase-like glycosyltransferase